MEFLTDVTYMHWLVFGLILIGIEVIVPSTFLLWPGISALFVGAMSLVLPTGPRAELVLFALLAVATSFFWHRWLGVQGEASDKPQLNRRAMQYIGRKAVLREAMVDGTGYISLDDTRWRVEADDGSNILEGEKVEVLGVEGVTLRVRRVSDDAVQAS